MTRGKKVSTQPKKKLAPRVTVHVYCDYCNGDAELVDSACVYGGNSYGMIWLCRPCKAWVGVHKGTTNPLGRLADDTLRKAKIAAHAAFDPLWQAAMRRDGLNKFHARGRAYKWLAGALGIERKDCHIGMFDVATCARVVEIIQDFKNRKKDT